MMMSETEGLSFVLASSLPCTYLCHNAPASDSLHASLIRYTFSHGSRLACMKSWRTRKACGAGNGSSG